MYGRHLSDASRQTAPYRPNAMTDFSEDLGFSKDEIEI